MTPESRILPGWAHQERQVDFAWISGNLDVFWVAGSIAFEDVGRGAIVIDIASLPVPGAGHLLGYLSQEQVEDCGDQDTIRMVAECEPTQELLLVLLKSPDRTSTYRVGVLQGELETEAAQTSASGHKSKPGPESDLEPPDIETLVAWEEEGGCEGACPHHCWVEPDGTCEHGHPSWLLGLGFIYTALHPTPLFAS